MAGSTEKTPFDIVQSTVNLPSTLNKLSEGFLAIESHFKSVVDNLNNEKSTIESNSVNILTSLKNQHAQQILDKENDLNNGTYVKKVVLELIDKWDGNRTIFNNLKWVLGCIPVAAVAFATLLGAKLGAKAFVLGTLVGGLGYWISNSIAKSKTKEIDKANSLNNEKSSFFNKSDINSLHEISKDLGEALDTESNKVKREIEFLRNTLEREYNTKERKEISDRNQKLKDHEQKSQSVIADLQNESEAIQKTKATLENLKNLLNQLPESFDPNELKWNNENIFKNKDSVASNFRIGGETIRINIEGTGHSIDVPRCIPFLNKSNIAFNCNNQNEIKEAIRISHNIIGRTLLSLPADKIKLTFIDPLGLGGNAAPYTPLLREIYGGMVFTQQNDIENQLSILTRAIENVIQRYLQDKFADIAEYNFKTKEVPEPYRLLVVYNFPHGFNDTTTNKLLNIIKSGPKAGVHTILINDKNAKPSYGMDWKAFEGINIKDV